MKVCYKLYLSYILISLLGGAAAYVGVKATQDIQRGFDRVANETIPVQNELNDLRNSVSSVVIYTNEIIFVEHTHSKRYKLGTESLVVKKRKDELAKKVDEWNSDKDSYRISLNTYENLVVKYFPEERKHLQEIKTSSQRVIKTSEDLLELAKRGGSDSQIILMQINLEKANEKFNDVIQEALDHEYDELKDRKDLLHSTINGYRQSIYLIALVAFLLAMAIAFRISRSLIKDIDNLKAGALRLGKGDLGTQIEPSTNNQELGILAIAFNQMAENLQHSTAHVISICESLVESLVVISPDAIIQSVNQSTCKLLGIDKEKLEGQPVSVLFADPSALLPKLAFDYLDKNGAIQSIEIHYRAKNGKEIPVLFSASLLVGNKGKKLGMVCVAQDITNLKHAQEANALQATALENVTDAIEITDNNATYLYVNKAFETITGYKEQEVLGKTPAALLRSGSHSPEFYQEIFDIVAKGEIWQGFLVSKHKNGTLYDQEVTLSPILNPAGVMTHIVAVKRDITERKRIEATLKEAERRWRTLLEEVSLIVIGLDSEGNVEYANPFFLELSGYTQVEVMGQDWFTNFLPRYQQQQVQRCFLDILNEDFHPHYENPILTKSGEERVIAWSNTLLRNPQGEIIGTMSIGEDITDQKSMTRMKDEFLSIVSHELRTPLTSIHGALDLLSSGLMDSQSDKGQRVIEIAAQSVDRLVLLVNDILDLERLESGKMRLSKQLCNTANLLQKSADTMKVMAKRGGIMLSLSPQTIELYADPERIIQVLTNLLSNAIKFAPSNSIIWLSTEVQETVEKEIERNGGQNSRYSRKILFKVQDQGRGIPRDKLESIFERFKQVDASDSRKKGGTGLGLAICRSIVEQHGGQIWVESALGKGSSFYFTLPMTEEEKTDRTQKMLTLDDNKMR
jgi:PAS domain S-box-containing protein